MSESTPTTTRSWLERLGHILSGEPHDREELIEILQDAADKKLLDIDALRMMKGVLEVSEKQVRDIMVPRAQMVVVELDAMPHEFLPTLIRSKHSRFPVIGENRDEIVGILLAKDLLRFTFSEEEDFNIQEVLRPVIFIPESKRLNVLLREFRINRNHMAIVVDEYGGVAGLVTIEDVLEEIVGEIEDEYDTDESIEQIKPLNDLQFNVNAITKVDDFNEYFGTNFSDEEFDTIGGLALQQFGHLPKRNETVTIKHIQFKVLQADNRRIRWLRVILPKPLKKK